MSDAERHSSLREEVLSGDNRELALMAARGLLPMPPSELIALQVALASSEAGQVGALAQQSLGDLDPKIAADVLAESTDVRVLEYLGEAHRHPLVLEAILRNRQVPSRLLRRLASGLEADLQEILLLRQDAIVEDPAILDALVTNPELTTYARRRVREYREHLVPSEKPEAGGAEGAVAAGPEEVSDDEVAEAIAEARGEPGEGEVEAVTGLTESQLKTLPVPIRLKLARGASRALRGILVRDANPQVATAVLKYNPIAESEIEQIASSRAVCDEVLEAIGRERKWVRKYSILNALVRNPRTPTGLSVRLVPRLAMRDLSSLSRDRNVPDAVRARALKLYRIKQG